MTAADGRSGAGTPVRVVLGLMPPFSARIEAGTELQFRISVQPEIECDLRGALYEICDETGKALTSGRLPQIERVTPDTFEYDPRDRQVDTRPFVRLAVRSPQQIGDHQLKFILLQQELSGLLVERAELPIACQSVAHRLSLAVWDNPSPVWPYQEMVLSVGAKCSGGCSLGGLAIQLRDEGGGVMGEARLGRTPRAGTDGLYWTRIRLCGPARQGRHRWQASLAARDFEVPHYDAPAAACSFIVAPSPDTRCTIQVLNRETGEPVGQVHTRLGPLPGLTDANGVVTFHVSCGTYGLSLWKQQAVAQEQQVEILEDSDLVVEVDVLPDRDPYEFYYNARPSLSV